MPIIFVCLECGAHVSVPGELAGRRVPCPKCSAVVTVHKAKRTVDDNLPEELPMAAVPEEDITDAQTHSHEAVCLPHGRESSVPRLGRSLSTNKSNLVLIVGLIASGLLLTCGLVVGGVVYGIYSFQSRLGTKLRDEDDLRLTSDPQADSRVPNLEREQDAREQQRRAAGLREMQEQRLTRLVKPLADVSIHESVVGSEMPSVTRIQGNGLTWAIVPLDIQVAGPRELWPDIIHRAPPVSGACWATDGGSYFALTRAGVLRRVAYPALKELRKVDFKQECHALGICKFGLIVTLGQLQEIWIVNPDTLAVAKRFGVSQLLNALTGPNLGVAYVFCRDTDRFGDKGAGLPVRVNLEDGSFAAMLPTHGSTVSHFFPRRVRGHEALSPDGKWLFADGGRLLRYRIDDTTLDARSHAGMGGGHKEGICVSADSKWVCFPTGGGNDGLGYATYVYRASDLSRPAFTLSHGAYPEIVGFDVAGKRILSQNFNHPLIVFDQNGTKRTEHQFGAVSGSHNVKQYAAHPTDGRGLLLRTNEHLLLIEFNSAD